MFCFFTIILGLTKAPLGEYSFIFSRVLKQIQAENAAKGFGVRVIQAYSASEILCRSGISNMDFVLTLLAS